MKWKAESNIAWQIVGGEVIIIDLGSGRALGLNSTGTFIWRTLLNEGEGEIAAALCREFNVERCRAEADARDFISWLSGRGLIRRVDDEPQTVTGQAPRA